MFSMEAVDLPYYSQDQNISPYKQIPRNPNVNIHKQQNPQANLLFNGGGILVRPPPYISQSLSLPLSIALGKQNPQAKPPLLPLPINNNKPCLQNRGVSWPPTTRKQNSKVRDRQDLKIKKSKASSGTTTAKKQDSGSGSGSGLMSTDRSGPEPSDLPKEVSWIMKPSVAFEGNHIEKLPGAVFYQSPPPSSLPLPKFSLRPKLSCNAEVGGIDTGATDNLRRLLRLQ